MIDVTVGQEDRVEPANVRPQSLLAKVDRGVDEYLGIAMLDQYRDPKPLVARVIGQASFAIARNRRYARRSACAEKGEFHLLEWRKAFELRATFSRGYRRPTISERLGP